MWTSDDTNEEIIWKPISKEILNRIDEEQRAKTAEPINFAKLDEMMQNLPMKYRRQPETAIIISVSTSSFIRRSIRRTLGRSLYGLRQSYLSQGLPLKRADRIARADYAWRSELREERSPGDATQSFIELLKPEDLFPDREWKDRWLGDRDVFVCCEGRGFHKTRLGDVYCPCAAGRKREALDESRGAFFGIRKVRSLVS